MNITEAYRQILKQVDSIDSRIIQRINIGLCIFVLVAMLGGLFIRLRDHSIDSIFYFGIVMIIISLASLSVTIIHNVTNRLYRTSLILSDILILMIIIACSESGIAFVAGEIPEGRFSWHPGLLTSLALYGHVFIVRRLIEVINHCNLKILLRWLSLGWVMIAFIADFGVFIAYIVLSIC